MNTRILEGVHPPTHIFRRILFCLFSFTPKETLKNSDFSEFLPNRIRSRVMKEFKNNLIIKNMNLQELYNTEREKALNEVSKYEQSRIKRWNEDLKACNEIYNQLSFIEGLEKVCCTDYNKSDADRGFYPYLRLGMIVIHAIHNDKDFVLSISYGKYQGMYSLESFVKKIASN